MLGPGKQGSSFQRSGAIDQCKAGADGIFSDPVAGRRPGP